MTAAPILPTEVTLKRMGELARDQTQGDNFLVRITWRGKPYDPPRVLCTLEEARLEQISQPEGWLSQLSGQSKGIFDLNVHHANDPSEALGPPLRTSFAQGRDEPFFNWDALQLDSYSGPRKVKYPVPAEAASRQGTAVMVTSPSHTGGSAAREVAPTPTAPPAPLFSSAPTDLIDQKLELASKRTELQLDGIRTEIRASAGQKSGTDIGAIVTGLVPVLVKVLDSQQSAAQRSQEQFMMMMQRSEQNTLAMLEKIGKPPAQDPITQVLVQKALNGNEQTVSLLNQMGTFMQQMGASYMQMLHAKAELQGDQAPQHPIMDMLTRLGEAYLGSMGAAQMGAAQAVTGEAAQLGAGAAVPMGAAEGQEVDGGDDAVEIDPLLDLELAIRSHASVDDVVERLERCLKDAEFNALLQQYKGFPGLFFTRLGKWMETKPENGAYVQQTLGKALAALQKKGLVGTATPQQQQAAAQAATAVAQASGPQQVPQRAKKARSNAAPAQGAPAQQSDTPAPAVPTA